MNTAILNKYGINTEKGIKRCLGNIDFYESILNMFLDDKTFYSAKASLEEKNYPKLFSFLHELKGISGNADLTELYENTVPLVELLRKGDTNDELISEMFSIIEKSYTKAREGITLSLN